MFVIFGVACFVLGIFAALLLTIDLHEPAAEDTEPVEWRKGFTPTRTDCDMDAFYASEQDRTEPR
jgi:hypothetical protein